MGTSDWGTWLPDTVAATTPDGVAIWYLGCNGFILKDAAGTTVMIDPYLGTGNPPRTIRMIPVPFTPDDISGVDAILATHEHSDHVDGESQAPILQNTGATFYAPPASIDVALNDQAWHDTWELRDEQFETIVEGETFQIGAFTITVGPAYDPDAIDPVSYIIEHPAGTMVHGGDTKPTDDFVEVGSEYDIDLAVVAFGSVGNLYNYEATKKSRKEWYCHENDVVTIANALQATAILPSHWDMWKGMTADPHVLRHHQRSWDYPERFEIVEIGDRIAL